MSGPWSLVRNRGWFWRCPVGHRFAAKRSESAPPACPECDVTDARLAERARLDERFAALETRIADLEALVRVALDHRLSDLADPFGPVDAGDA